MTDPGWPSAVMVFAAGLGTRMGPLTADRPKPLVEVAGRALIDRALDLVEEARLPARAVVNAHYRAPQLMAHLAARPSRLPVLVADETAALLETGGGLRAALPLLGPDPGSVWTLNSDAAWAGPNPLAALAGAWDPGMEALLLLVPRERAVGYRGAGDFDRDATGRLARGGGFVYTGAQILRTEGLHAIPDRAFSLNRLWDAMAARGGLHGLVWPGRWCDVGRPESIPLAEAMLADVAGPGGAAGAGGEAVHAG